MVSGEYARTAAAAGYPRDEIDPAIRFSTRLRPTSGARTSGTAGDREPGRTDEAAPHCASSSTRFSGRRKQISPFEHELDEGLLENWIYAKVK